MQLSWSQIFLSFIALGYLHIDCTSLTSFSKERNAGKCQTFMTKPNDIHMSIYDRGKGELREIVLFMPIHKFGFVVILDSA